MPMRYHRKTCARGLLAFITAISVSVLLLFCTHNVAMADDTVQLQDVMNGKVSGLSVTVNGTGHYFGACINTNFINVDKLRQIQNTGKKTLQIWIAALQ